MLILALVPSMFTLVFLLVVGAVRGVKDVVMADSINKVVSSHIRATVLSTQALVSSLFFVLFSPMIGYVTDAINLQTALLILGTITFVSGGISVFYLKRHEVI